MIDIKWHYTKGVQFYLQSWENYMHKIIRFFSVPVLFKTLFSPWKRMSVTNNKPGISMQRTLDELSFNLTSRTVGFLVRFWLIIASAVVFLFAALFGVIGFVIWLLLPPLSLQVQRNYKRQPDVIAQKLVHEILSSEDPIRTLFDNEPGEFALSHVGLEINKMIHGSVKNVGLDTKKEFNGYAEVLSHVIDSGVWPPEFWKDMEVLSDDLVLAAAIWDSKRAIETGMHDGDSSVNVKGVGVQLLFGYTPTIDQIGTEYRLMDKKHTILRGRDDVLKRIERIFESKSSV